MTITTAQMRGARGLLNWSQSELSKRTGISTTSIGNIEAGNTQARESTLRVIRQAFENAGIEFIGTEGMRKRTDYIRTYEGREQFWDFYEDIYSTLQSNKTDILVSNADEKEFAKWLNEEQISKHIERMVRISAQYRILISEDDNFTLATSKYAQYRGMPSTMFSSVPFYIYGGKLAIIQFNPEPYICVINNAAVANAYKLQFEALWSMSRPLTSEAA